MDEFSVELVSSLDSIKIEISDSVGIEIPNDNNIQSPAKYYKKLSNYYAIELCVKDPTFKKELEDIITKMY